MSFRIFAAGTTARARVFNYNRAGLDIGDIYDGAEALGAIASSPGASAVALGGFLRGTVETVAGQVRDAASDTITQESPQQRGVTTMGRLAGARLMVTNFSILCARRPLHLFFTVRGSSSMFNYSGGTLIVVIDSTISNPASYLLRRLTPLLARCGLNGFGVLSGLAEVFVGYDAVAAPGADRVYRLNIDITAT